MGDGRRGLFLVLMCFLRAPVEFITFTFVGVTLSPRFITGGTRTASGQGDFSSSPRISLHKVHPESRALKDASNLPVS